MANYAAYFKHDDAWYLDGSIRSLFRQGRHDAVNLFYAMVAFAHAKDTDGVVSMSDVCDIGELLMLPDVPDMTPYVDALLKASLIRRTKGRKLVLNAYTKWQTTSDQRKDWRDSKAIPRGTDAESEAHSVGREEKRRDKKQTHTRPGARPAAAAASPPGVGNDGPTDKGGSELVRDWTRPGPAVYIDPTGKRANGSMRRIGASEPEE